MATYEELIRAGYTNAQAINGQTAGNGLSADQLQAATHGQDWRRGGDVIDQNGVMRLRDKPLSADELNKIAKGQMMTPSANMFTRDLGGVGYMPPRNDPPIDAIPGRIQFIGETTQPPISTSAKVQIVVAKIKGWFARLFS